MSISKQYLTYLSRHWRDGVGTLSRLSAGQVVKASQGHYPQPFLISGKRTDPKIIRSVKFQKIIFCQGLITWEQAASCIVIIFIDSNYYD